jgi:hypothetical protein
VLVEAVVEVDVLVLVGPESAKAGKPSTEIASPTAKTNASASLRMRIPPWSRGTGTSP